MNKKIIERINWDSYKKFLISSIQNEKLWEFMSFDDEQNVHTLNIRNMEKELSFIYKKEYLMILDLHKDSEDYFNDFLN